MEKQILRTFREYLYHRKIVTKVQKYTGVSAFKQCVILTYSKIIAKIILDDDLSINLPCCVHKLQIPEASKFLHGGPCAPFAGFVKTLSFLVQMLQKCCFDSPPKPQQQMQSAL